MIKKHTHHFTLRKDFNELKEIKKIKGKVIKWEQTKPHTQKNIETKSRFLEKIKYLGELLAKLNKRKNTQVNTIMHEKGDIVKITKQIQKAIRTYFRNLYSTKLENLKDMNEFLDASDS